MSNERSPRDVCSITIGINGLMQSPCFRSRAWGPQRFLFLGLFLVWRPDRFPRLRLVERDRLHLGRDPVERRAEAQILAQVFLASVVPQILDHVVGILARRFSLLANQILDL